MSQYQHITVIYNPKSTGKSQELAEQFVIVAKATWPKVDIALQPTKRAGHAEELAATAAKKRGEVLVVSASGDGGYNEVVNGVIKSGVSLAHVTCLVLPAGNANDHSRTLHKTPIIDRLKAAKELKIDLLKVVLNNGGKTSAHYAHSYAGLGLTPEVGKELNRHDLNSFNEKVLAAKTVRKLEPVRILHAGKERTYQSLVFSNINRMAKVLTFTGSDMPTDGKFEVIAFRTKTKFGMLMKVLKAALWFVRPQTVTERYDFTALHNMTMQLDGEIVELKKGTAVTVQIAPKALSTLI